MVLCQRRGGGGGQNDGQSGSSIILPLLSPSLPLSFSLRLSPVSNCLHLIKIHEREMMLLMSLSTAALLSSSWSGSSVVRRLEHPPVLPISSRGGAATAAIELRAVYT